MYIFHLIIIHLLLSHFIMIIITCENKKTCAPPSTSSFSSCSSSSSSSSSSSDQCRAFIPFQSLSTTTRDTKTKSPLQNHDSNNHQKPQQRQQQQQHQYFRSWAELYQWSLNQSHPTRIPTQSATNHHKDHEETQSTTQKHNNHHPDTKQAEDLPNFFDTSLDELKQALTLLSTTQKNFHDKTTIFDDKTKKKMLESLVFISDLCHSIDYGIDMMTMGGLEILGRYLEHCKNSNLDICYEVLGVFNTCLRNNEQVGKHIMKLKLIDKIIMRLNEIDFLKSRVLGVLNGIVGIIDGEQCLKKYGEDVVKIIDKGLDGNIDNVEGKRQIVRALYLSSELIRIDGKDMFWKKLFKNFGIEFKVKLLANCYQVDVKEGVETFTTIWDQHS